LNGVPATAKLPFQMMAKEQSSAKHEAYVTGSKLALPFSSKDALAHCLMAKKERRSTTLNDSSV